MRPLQLANKWILVTGASSGLGREMARLLAKQFKANLILTARRRDKLEELKEELLATGVEIRVLVADLAKEEDIARIVEESTGSRELYGAILNAGVTYFGRHADLPWDKFMTILQTNVLSVVSLTNHLVNYFEANGKEGAIMIVSSMAALFPVPYQAAYSGTKGFILNFISALSHELKNPGLSLTVYAPAGIATEMTGDERFENLKGWLMPAEQAAREGIYAFRHRKYTYVPGFFNRAGAIFMRFLPSRFIAAKMGRVYRAALLKSEQKS
ncbi:SDR family NAD(P)-dependent oxidoreductase [Pararcticibacter amylolyticus]|uniref:Ketoreductase domain-containing protein n=1 Tax=Pararcticibacter amylolyticus TaxID=2173175 RepID=A0A2U2PFJ9_9SPHI|nr:SDR family NAD(P)-dependent oxidoreductase [Pararcticibacter amylolyticus]PWG80140.1 hypothetical protein DDR33_13140 [Pararcticibacter amylolyticus]